MAARLWAWKTHMDHNVGIHADVDRLATLRSECCAGGGGGREAARNWEGMAEPCLPVSLGQAPAHARAPGRAASAASSGGSGRRRGKGAASKHRRFLLLFLCEAVVLDGPRCKRCQAADRAGKQLPVEYFLHV